MKGILILLLLFLAGCPPQKDELLAHWQCADGSYQQSKEGCYLNSCTQDSDCKVQFYSGLCSMEQDSFPVGVIPPRYEPVRCIKDTCSTIMPTCVAPAPTILLAKCKRGLCMAEQKPRKIVLMGGKEFSVAVAESNEEKARGLMHAVPESPEGMMFVYEKQARPRFWMKNTLSPLDIIFIDEQHKIVSFVTAQPCSLDPCPTYSPPRKISWVLEVKGGTTEKLGVQNGEFIEIR